jgi:DNA-binding transcriptional LysR family regulator
VSLGLHDQWRQGRWYYFETGIVNSAPLAMLSGRWQSTYANRPDGRRIASRGDLSDDILVGYIDEPTYLPSVQWLEGIVKNPKIRFRATSMFSQMFAAQEGFGIALLPSYANAESIGLVKVMEEKYLAVPLFVSVQHDLQYLPHIRTVFDTVEAYLRLKIIH